MACVCATDVRAGFGGERAVPTEPRTDLEDILDKAGLRDDDIVIRMTGCPNGARGLIWRRSGSSAARPGLYNLYLGAAFNGTRLSKIYAQDVNREQILKLLEPIIKRTRRSAMTASISAISCARTGNRGGDNRGQ